MKLLQTCFYKTLRCEEQKIVLFSSFTSSYMTIYENMF